MKAKTWAGAAAVAMLLAISSANLVPTLIRVCNGDKPAIGQFVVQIALTVILAIIPFVPCWDAELRKQLTIAFMLGNGWFAFQNAEHWHDGERTAHNQREIWSSELGKKQTAKDKLGTFTPTDDSQVAAAQKTADEADADKARARTSADTAKAKFAACEKGCTKLDQEVKRLETEAKQRDAGAKTAHDELQKLSGWRTLTNQAAPINARIDVLNEKLGSEKFVADTGSDSDIFQKAEALFIAFLIELGNRYGPQGIFVFIMGLAAASPSKAAEPEPARKPEPEARKSEISTGNDAPASPRKQRKSAGNGGRKSIGTTAGNAESAQIIDFRKRPTREEILAFLDGGKRKMWEAAEHFRYTERHLRNILNESSASQARQAAA